MNIVNRSIQRLRDHWRHRQEQVQHCKWQQGAAWCDGYQAGLQDATSDVEMVLRGLDTFEAVGLPTPDPERQWYSIPLYWANPPLATAQQTAPSRTPVLTLRLELTGNNTYGWRSYPQIWVP